MVVRKIERVGGSGDAAPAVIEKGGGNTPADTPQRSAAIEFLKKNHIGGGWKMHNGDSSKSPFLIHSPFLPGEAVEVDVLPSNGASRVTVKLQGVTSGAVALIALDITDLHLKGGAVVS